MDRPYPPDQIVSLFTRNLLIVGLTEEVCHNAQIKGKGWMHTYFVCAEATSSPRPSHAELIDLNLQPEAETWDFKAGDRTISVDIPEK